VDYGQASPSSSSQPAYEWDLDTDAKWLWTRRSPLRHHMKVDGQGNFAALQYDSLNELENLLVDTVGAYSGGLN
jgi:hypothetical protein